MAKQFRIERRQGKDGKFHYLVLLGEKHGYYVYDQDSLNKFCDNNDTWCMWPVGDNPWSTFDNSHYRAGIEPVSAEHIMTSSYEEVCKYLKVNALIGTI